MKHNAFAAIAAALTLPAAPSFAATLDVPRLPDPVFADREVSAASALPAGRLDGLRVFRLEISFDATPSNNVQVSLGRDTAPADGSLDAGETYLAIGWDRGEWFLSPRGLRIRHAAPAASSNGLQRLTARIRVTSQGVFLPPSFADATGAVVFESLSTDPFPEWLRPDTWDHLRVTVRGADTPQENIKAVFAPDGARISVK
ncbi:MAG: hypothetical protein PHG96_02525 [Kiritimatiellae bacterium]|nr:hypothetical protein [Kiritimatiellia bacterium]